MGVGLPEVSGRPLRLQLRVCHNVYGFWGCKEWRRRSRVDGKAVGRDCLRAQAGVGIEGSYLRTLVRLEGSWYGQ